MLELTNVEKAEKNNNEAYLVNTKSVDICRRNIKI